MAEHGKQAQGPESFDREIRYRAIFVFMGVIAVVTVAAFVLMWWMGIGFLTLFERMDPEPTPVVRAEAPPTPPLPHLQVESYADWAAMRAAHDEHLSTYGWVDRSTGRIRVPVEEAMARVAHDGLPTFPAVAEEQKP